MIGLVARVDNGGLGTQTVEFARHMLPEITVVMQLGTAGRGGDDIKRLGYHGTGNVVYKNTPGVTLDDITAFLLANCDAVYVAEATYGDALARAGAPIVLHANPELFRPDYEIIGARLFTPTDWELGRMPAGTVVLPVPVALERFEYRRRTEARRFAFVCGPAMLDRNGYDLLMAALPFIESTIHIGIHGAPLNAVRVTEKPPNVGVTFYGATDEYWDVLRDDEPDVLVMPRRYGGLCLPVQEAAAQGIPSIMLDVEPKFPGSLRVPAFTQQIADMKGGKFRVYDTDPRWLANAIDYLAETPHEVGQMSDDAHDWATAISWDAQLPVYEEVFRG